MSEASSILDILVKIIALAVTELLGLLLFLWVRSIGRKGKKKKD